jgi:hypothetical protein
VAYNLVWGLAWFAFMRREWLSAAAARKQAFPFTEIWAIWLVLTIPIGVAIVWFCASNRLRYGPGPKVAVRASAASWVSMTVPMVAWAAVTSLPMGVIALDSVVNLAALLAASLVAAPRASGPTAAGSVSALFK